MNPLLMTTHLPNDYVVLSFLIQEASSEGYLQVPYPAVSCYSLNVDSVSCACGFEC